MHHVSRWKISIKGTKETAPGKVQLLPFYYERADKDSDYNYVNDVNKLIIFDIFLNLYLSLFRHLGNQSNKKNITKEDRV